MEYSSNYNKVKRYFVLGVWDEGRVRNAVEKGWITIHTKTEWRMKNAKRNDMETVQ